MTMPDFASLAADPFETAAADPIETAAVDADSVVDPLGLAELPLESMFRRHSPDEITTNPRIMIVDDEPVIIKVVSKYLESDGYKNFVTTTEPRNAFDMAITEQPDVIVLDIMMPEVSGLQILQQIRNDSRVKDVPVIILTASTDADTKHEALELGATDFLNKPVDPLDLTPRMRNALVVKAHHDTLTQYAWELELEVAARTTEIAAAQQELVQCLAQVAEHRDNETGQHVTRVAKYAGIIARSLECDPHFVTLIEQAAPLHDMGKICVPDSILNDPGKLDAEEFEFIREHCGFEEERTVRASCDDATAVKNHTLAGARILNASSSPVLKMATRIALSHHERWDGNGYPLGLAGEKIPIEGRITAVADVFDSLVSKKPFKPALPIDQCLRILMHGRGTHFEPTIIDAFIACRDEIVGIHQEFTDAD